jgi:hypothetical protein
MLQGLHRRAVVVALALTLGVLSLAPHLVAAAPGNGAIVETTRVDQDNCYDQPENEFRWCYSLHGVVHTMTTPSGNQTASFHGETCTTEIFQGRVVYHSCVRDQLLDFDKDGVFQVYHDSGTGEGYSDGEYCTGWFVFQFVNGEIRALNGKSECTPA